MNVAWIEMWKEKPVKENRDNEIKQCFKNKYWGLPWNDSDPKKDLSHTSHKDFDDIKQDFLDKGIWSFGMLQGIWW